MRAVNERIWVKQIIDRYDSIEKRQPKSFDLLVEEWPRWVLNLWPTLFGIAHSGLNFKRVKKWTAKDLGMFLGRQSALEGLVWGEVPLSPRVEKEMNKFVEWQNGSIELNKNFANTMLEATQGMKKWRPVFKNFIDETLVAAHARPYPESAAFLEAFGKANVIKPDEFASEHRLGVGERIACVMILFWRPISKLESVSQLHQLLSAAAKPTGIVITLKRVEKLCYRIGLKFKGRGRPKKKIIQTNLIPAA